MAPKITLQQADNPNRLIVRFAYNPDFLEKFKQTMGGRKWEADEKYWTVPKTKRNLFNLAQWQGKNVFGQWDAKITDQIDPLVAEHESSAHLFEGMWKHQNMMFNHAYLRKQAIIAGEMRTGKTRPMLALLRYLGDTRRTINTPIWVAPKSAIRGLKKELSKWGHPHSITLLTYDKFRSTMQGLDDLTHEDKSKIIPNVIVFDEAHKLKSQKAIQSQVAEEVCNAQTDLYGDNRWTLFLSGTPAPKTPIDWWNICELACPGFLAESNPMELTKRIADWEESEIGGNKFVKVVSWKKSEVEKLYRRMTGLVEVFLKKDCLDLPPKIYDVITTTIDPQYAKMASMLTLKEKNGAQLLGALRELSDGFQYISKTDEETATKSNDTYYLPNCPKDDVLRDLLDEYDDVGRVVIGVGFSATVAKVSKICLDKSWVVLKIDGKGWEVYGSSLPVDCLLSAMDRSFNPLTSEGGKYAQYADVLESMKLAVVAQADSASTGLEFSASPVLIFYSNSFNGGSRMQFEDRGYSNNMNKETSLTIIDIVHLPTDLLVRDNLLTKKTLQSITLGEVFEALGESITNVESPIN